MGVFEAERVDEGVREEKKKINEASLLDAL